MTELKQKRLLVIFGVVAGIFLVMFLFQTRAKKKEIAWILGQDSSNIAYCLLECRTYQVEENRYPPSLKSLYPDYISYLPLPEPPRFQAKPSGPYISEPYIYLVPSPDSTGKIPEETVVLISPFPYPREQRLVGYAAGNTGLIHEKNLPDLKNHSPAN
ncbi:hypothetical protein OAK81_00670 [Verrucomicrobiales bacterium]|nr:hypothetical protein [Verrucomicrobiales bacterium]